MDQRRTTTIDFSSNRCTAIAMGQYRILVFCKDCGRPHPMKGTVLLDDGPAEKTTIAEAYKNKPPPLEIVKILKKDILCPELAISVTLEDPNKVYLVPID